jgi:hypothetical protein
MHTLARTDRLRQVHAARSWSNAAWLGLLLLGCGVSGGCGPGRSVELPSPQDADGRNRMVLALQDAGIEGVREIVEGRFGAQQTKILVPAADEHRARQILESQALLPVVKTDSMEQLPQNPFTALDSRIVPDALHLMSLSRLEDALQAIPGVREVHAIAERDGQAITISLSCRGVPPEDLAQQAHEQAHASFSRIPEDAIKVQIFELPAYTPPVAETQAGSEGGAEALAARLPSGTRSFWVALCAAVLMGILVLIQTLRLAKFGKLARVPRPATGGGAG